MHRKKGWLFTLAGLIPTLLILTWGLLRSPQNAFDDAFITYRYADNLRRGLGLVYNPGQWVLGTTAPLYAILLGALGKLGGGVEGWGHWVSVAAWIAAAWAALGQLWQRGRPVAGALAALLLAVLPLAVPTLGMETLCLLALLLLASWAWMSDRRFLAPILSAVAVLTRQDAALFIGLLFIAAALRRHRVPWFEGILSVGLTLPWFAYAYWRYGSFLPNSVLAKVNQNQLMAVGGSQGFAEQLLWHLTGGQPLVTLAVGLALVIGLYVIARHARQWWWLPAWVTLYVAAYIALNVASSFPWYYLPPVAGVLLTAALGLGHLLGDRGVAGGGILSGVEGGILSGVEGGILSGVEGRAHPSTGDRPRTALSRPPAQDASTGDRPRTALRRSPAQDASTGDRPRTALRRPPAQHTLTVLRGVFAAACALAILIPYGRATLMASRENRAGYLAEYREVGAWLAANTAATDRVATIEIGVIGYLAGRSILDTMGLVSPEMRGHLVGWAETLTYAVRQHRPAYLIALSGTAWDQLTPQWWFRQSYRRVAAFGRATIYKQQAAPVLAYAVQERTDFAPGFAVTGLETTAQVLTPGELLEVELDVEVTGNPGRDCEVFLRLVDAVTFAPVSETKGAPYGGTYGCPAWQPGDALRIPLQMMVPPDIAPGAYRLGLEFYAPAQDAFFPLAADPNQQAVQLGWLRAGDPVQPPAADAAEALHVQWENGIVLTGVARPAGLLPRGEALAVQFTWQATQDSPQRNLTFFAHLIDARDDIVAQTDRRPFDGRFPTTVWRPGEILRDTYAIPVPPDLPAGEYRLRVGFYDDAGRLPLAGGSADYAVLGITLAAE